MKLTGTINEDILEFERVTGKLITESKPLIQRLAEAGDYFDNLGAKDAAEGRPQRSRDDFLQWGKKELPYPHREDDPIVDLMYRCYRDGYNTQRRFQQDNR